MSLLLEIKLQSSENWLKISPQRARELTTENNAAELRKLQNELRERNSIAEDASWSTSSVNSIPLGPGPPGPSRGWKPPAREFGGER